MLLQMKDADILHPQLWTEDTTTPTTEKIKAIEKTKGPPFNLQTFKSRSFIFGRSLATLAGVYLPLHALQQYRCSLLYDCGVSANCSANCFCQASLEYITFTIIVTMLCRGAAGVREPQDAGGCRCWRSASGKQEHHSHQSLCRECACGAPP